MSSEPESLIYLARHGETAWSLTGQHTGLTDLPLTERGERNARQLGARLAGLNVSRVFVSPLLRARQTCELAGFGAIAEVDSDLAEWDYGQYEGLTRTDIHKSNPEWRIFRDGCPGGESVADVCARAERVVARLRALDECVLLFSSGHIMEMFTTRWLDWPAETATRLFLDTASLSIVGYHRTNSNPVLRLWNCRKHAERDE
ncbi:Alpha-ribazole phosphatase [Anatilimnocola aggregata]|uniref:Alpha-ribazole phosphatase n=1 Tax=Anatilimnocola aggregata TaxID=2528021 RepID=A0A517YDQ9_9BACT|nr:histidine phosphatase family protein [Anatilimnocola aggregata]QDU28374.1 Alpha-ribazole phosphatase [Anatilimnocola aggregata]